MSGSPGPELTQSGPLPHRAGGKPWETEMDLDHFQDRLRALLDTHVCRVKASFAALEASVEEMSIESAALEAARPDATQASLQSELRRMLIAVAVVHHV